MTWLHVGAFAAVYLAAGWIVSGLVADFVARRARRAIKELLDDANGGES